MRLERRTSSSLPLRPFDSRHPSSSSAGSSTTPLSVIRRTLPHCSSKMRRSRAHARCWLAASETWARAWPYLSSTSRGGYCDRSLPACPPTNAGRVASPVTASVDAYCYQCG